MSGFRPVLHLPLSEGCPACPLLWGGVQSAALKKSLQAPFPCSGYVRTGMIGLLTFIACESLVSDFQSPTKKGRQSSAGVNLFLIKIYNLAPRVGVAVGFRQAAGLLLPI